MNDNHFPARRIPSDDVTQEKRQWYSEKKDVHALIFAAAEQIDQSHSARTSEYSLALNFYENRSLDIPGTLKTNWSHFGSRLNYNIIKSVVDTAASKLAANKPSPEFNTNDGDWRADDQAEKLTQYTNGVFYSNDTFNLINSVVRDALVWGTGVIQVYPNGSDIKHERVRIDEILVDEYEAQYLKPNNLYQRRKLYRNRLLEKAIQGDWGTKAIEAINSANPTSDTSSYSNGEMIEVIEAWHLPIKNKKGQYINGKHAVVIDNFTLSLDDYQEPDFPFVFFRWDDPLIGFYGLSLAEQLYGIQEQITVLLIMIKKAMKQAGLKVIIPIGSGINPSHLANTNLPIIEADGTPTPITFPAVSQDAYNYLESLINRAYELTGISQAQATATKAPGVDSAVAMNTLSDQQTERYMSQAGRYERFSANLAAKTIQVARMYYTSNLYSADNSTPNAKLIKEIKWKDDSLANSSYRTQINSVSAFSLSPAAKLQNIKEMAQAGYMSPTDVIANQGDNPDYRHWQKRATSSADLVRMYLDLMMREKSYHPPTQYMNLEEAITIARDEINYATTKEVPDDRIQLMRDFVEECMQMSAPEPAEAPPGPPMGDMGAPQAEPQALPTSDLMPMAPPPGV